MFLVTSLSLSLWHWASTDPTESWRFFNLLMGKCGGMESHLYSVPLAKGPLVHSHEGNRIKKHDARKWYQHLCNFSSVPPAHPGVVKDSCWSVGCQGSRLLKLHALGSHCEQRPSILLFCPWKKITKVKNQMLNCQAAVRGWRAISCTYLFIYWWKVGALVKTKAKKNTQLCVRNKGHCLCSSQVCSPRAVNILSLPPWLWDLLQKLGTFPAPSCTKDSWPILHLGHLSFISVSHKALSRFILFNGPLFFFFSWFYCHRKFSLFYYLFPVGTGLKIKWINKYICIHIKTCRQESHSDLERPW